MPQNLPTEQMQIPKEDYNSQRQMYEQQPNIPNNPMVRSMPNMPPNMPNMPPNMPNMPNMLNMPNNSNMPPQYQNNNYTNDNQQNPYPYQNQGMNPNDNINQMAMNQQGNYPYDNSMGGMAPNNVYSPQSNSGERLRMAANNIMN